MIMIMKMIGMVIVRMMKRKITVIMTVKGYHTNANNDDNYENENDDNYYHNHDIDINY